MGAPPLAAVDRRLLNEWQHAFPLEPRPYARVGSALGLSEPEVRARLASLHDAGALSRVGAVVRPNTAGASTLVAMTVPPDRLAAVAAAVSDEPEVNHNYEREHRLNLWFVVTAQDRARVDAALARIARKTGLPVLELPLVTEYRIDLGFDLP